MAIKGKESIVNGDANDDYVGGVDDLGGVVSSKNDVINAYVDKDRDGSKIKDDILKDERKHVNVDDDLGN